MPRSVRCRRVAPPAAAMALAMVAGALLGAGCGTGPRPALGEPVDQGGEASQPTGIAAIDPLLQRLEGDGPGPFTATYTITRKLGPVTTIATVARQGDVTAVTIGDVRFFDGPAPATCTLSTSTCEPGVHEQRISELGGLTSHFWSSSAARYLRLSAMRRQGEPQPSTATIAGLSVDCVALPIGNGVEHYCVTPAGPIARIDRADATVELTAWSDSVDPALLTRPG